VRRNNAGAWCKGTKNESGETVRRAAKKRPQPSLLFRREWEGSVEIRLLLNLVKSRILKYLLLLLSIVLISFIGEGHKASTNKATGLRGRVKNITEDYLSLYTGIKHSSNTFYSPDGSLYMNIYIEYLREGPTIDSFQYVYGEKNRLIEKKRHRIQFGESSRARQEYAYDSAGNLIEEKYWGHDNTMLAIKEYTYKKGVMVEAIEKNGKGDVLSRSTYTSEGDDSIIEHTIYPPKRGPQDIGSKQVHKHNKKFNLVEENTYKLTGEHLSKIIRIYDNSHNEIERSSFDRKGNIDFQVKMMYDSSNNLVSTQGYRYKNTSYKYDNRYTYDQMGNYITDSIFDGAKLMNITHRKIEYYK
jgi:hypothetical protein